MEVELLLSTIRKEKIEDLALEQHGIVSHVTIVNQLVAKESVQKEKNIVMYSYPEMGISNSRNRLLSHMRKEIVMITDDDVTFLANYEDKIKEAYQKLPQADIILFSCVDELGHPRRKYPKKVKKLSTFDLLHACSIEISFLKKKIEEKELAFDTDFGLKAKFGLGEENIFLMDAKRKKLRIYFYPCEICSHKKESTGAKWDQKTIYSIGALYERLFGWWGFFFAIPFSLLKYPIYHQSVNMITFYKYYIKGMKERRIGRAE